MKSCQLYKVAIVFSAAFFNAFLSHSSAQILTQQGPKLIGMGGAATARQGFSVALSADGNTALAGGLEDNGAAGALCVWTRSGGVCTQQGPKLVAMGAVGIAGQGFSVALSADGN